MQRQYLDQLKNRGAPIVVNIEEDLSAPEQTTAATEQANDAVTVKGLVYRKGGRSAAWVNNSNTFEGDITSGYSEISEDKITPSNVNINIGNQNRVIRLKVGEEYEPATDNIRDIIGKTNSKIIVNRP